jgi:hypothetical protein
LRELGERKSSCDALKRHARSLSEQIAQLSRFVVILIVRITSVLFVVVIISIIIIVHHHSSSFIIIVIGYR